MSARYWHGGMPGLKVGDRILPPCESGTERRLIDSLPYAPPDDVARDDVVYLSTDRNVAKGYAAYYPDGALYEVRPVGELEPDPDCNVEGLSWRAPAAEVVSVVDPVVLLRSRPLHWLRVIAKGGAS